MVIGGRTLISAKEGQATGRLDRDIPTLLRLISETSEEQRGLTDYAETEIFSMDLAKWGLTDSAIVEQAEGIAQEITTSYLPLYFPKDRTPEEYSELLNEIACQISIAYWIVRRNRNRDVDLKSLYLTPEELEGKTREELWFEGLLDANFAVRLTNMDETVKTVTRNYILSLTKAEAKRKLFITYLDEISPDKTSWGKYEVIEESALREERILLGEGISAYPLDLEDSKGSTRATVENDLLTLNRQSSKGRKLWTIQFPLLIPSRMVRQLFFDPNADIRLLREWLRMDLR